MISFWQKTCSYLKEVHLETLLDHSSMPISVYLRKNRLQLVSNNAIYSYDDYYINFLYALKKLKLNKQKNHKVLVLGFGLGSIVYILEKKLNISAEYTAVELSEEVLYLAAKYSLPRFDAHVAIFQADASAFVLQTNEKFDLICIDVFQDDFIPDNVRDPEFLKTCKDLLNSSGYLVFNQLYLTPKDKAESEKFTKEVFLPIFDGAESLYIGGNNMLIYQNPAI